MQNQTTKTGASKAPITQGDKLMLFRALLITLFFTGSWLSTPAVAHGPERTQSIKQYEPRSDPVTQGKIHMKMDVAEQTIRLFITDQFDQPVDVGLASATAFLAINGSNTMLQLVPEADNVLSAQAFFAPDPTLKVHVTLRLPGRQPINQSFTPLRK
jgi:hypothetical protein